MITLHKISVIIPVYNVAEYVTGCLQSVMRQTYKGNIECILVDDCGNDKSIAVVEQLIADYKGSIDFRILHHEHNRGLSAARNTGTDAATGDYIYYLDSDDFITDDCLKKLVEPLAIRDYDVVIGDYEMFGDRHDATLLLEQREEIIGNNDIFESYSNRQLYVMAWNKLCKLAFIRENNITFLEGQIHEDDLWTYKMMLVIDSMAIIHNATYCYRMRNNSIITNSTNTLKKAESLKDTLHYIQTHPYSKAKEHNKCICYYWGRYLQYAFDGKVSFYDEYRSLRNTCTYKPLELFIQGRMSLAQLKKRLHFALPIKMGYRYLQLRNIKNKL